MKALGYLLELAVALVLVPFVRLARMLGIVPRRVTIIGWWGSETVGDIAILGQLLTELDLEAPDALPTVVSFDAPLTRASLAQLERQDVRVLPLGMRSAFALVATRAVIVGGGPLLESPSMRLWAWRARVARLAGARVLCYANGIGPLRSARCTAAIAALLRTATTVVVRDEVSVAWVRRHVPERAGDVTRSFDPAYDYVRSECLIGVPRGEQLALALRTPPANYLGHGDVAGATEAFLDTLSRALDELLARRPSLGLVGIVMHTGHDDSDDHAVYQRLRGKLAQGQRLSVAAGAHTLPAVIAAMQQARAALTVRFHAMIVALATETPFVALDYARPEGKVSAAAADAGVAAHVIAWDALDASELLRRLEQALDAPPPTTADLRWAQDVRRAALRAALAP